METIMPILSGILYAVAIYFMLQKNILKLALGLVLLTNATNLFIFCAGRLTRAIPPIIPLNSSVIVGEYANPVSEALILTAIVIGFGFLSFVLALVYGLLLKFSSLDPDTIGEADE